MIWLYLAINLTVVLFPLIISFDKKMQFYREWPTLFGAIGIVAVFYILFDILFTHLGVWGFNQAYVTGINIANLPIEEVLFFITIPFASVFLHYSFKFVFPGVGLNQMLAKYASLGLIFGFTLVALLFADKLYTIYSSLLVVASTLLAIIYKPKVLPAFFVTFLVILVPFFVVNGILTGSFIDGEVVWYNNAENLNVRLFTIPIEDVGYGYSLVLLNILVKEIFDERKRPVHE